MRSPAVWKKLLAGRGTEIRAIVHPRGLGALRQTLSPTGFDVNARWGAALLPERPELPWWVSVGVAATVYVVLTFVVPSITFNDIFLKNLAPLAPRFAGVAAAIFLLPAALSAIQSIRKRRMLDRQSGIESIRSLSWEQFEELLGEGFRRQGYSVQENTRAGPDGGIDLTIKRDGNVYLVQCKQWHAAKVGVNVVREMLGLVTAHGAHGAIIVTSGMFTQEAKSFASGKSIDLVEGRKLVDMIQAVQGRSAVPTSAAAVGRRPGTLSERSAASLRRCPRCGGDLIVRVARRGPRAGSRFWGCSGYPGCKHTEAYEG
jgi:restriction system protein